MISSPPTTFPGTPKRKSGWRPLDGLVQHLHQGDGKRMLLAAGALEEHLLVDVLPLPLMMQHRMDRKLQYFIDKDDPALCQRIGEHFYPLVRKPVLYLLFDRLCRPAAVSSLGVDI